MFNLSVSNIGWENVYDEEMYGVLKASEFEGLEIAPTRIISEAPYDNVQSAKKWAKSLMDEYGLVIPSMQSIWFGRQENIFASSNDREALLAYTKKAIEFAEAIKCKNLVFGCPRNRNMIEGANEDDAIVFFKEIGEYALAHNTVIGMEANPPIYNTNYINDTRSAIELIKKVDSQGFKLNLDFGTIVQNGEDLSVVAENVYLVNHVHISEPHLRKIEKRQQHIELRDILASAGYDGFVSIEMGKTEGLDNIKDAMEYIKQIFS